MTQTRGAGGRRRAAPAVEPGGVDRLARGQRDRAPTWRSSSSVPIAAPIAPGATVRCIAICRPESTGPMPRPISAHEHQALPVGRRRVEGREPERAERRQAEAAEDRRAVLAALDDQRAGDVDADHEPEQQRVDQQPGVGRADVAHALEVAREQEHAGEQAERAGRAREHDRRGAAVGEQPQRDDRRGRAPLDPHEGEDGQQRGGDQAAGPRVAPRVRRGCAR